MNKVNLIGNLTKDPELNTTQSGVNYCRFSLAVNRPYSKERETDFFNIVVWRAQAENCYKYLKKGSKAGVSGYLQTRTYEGSDGTKKYSVDVVADDIEFLSSKQGEKINSNTENQPVVTNSTQAQTDVGVHTFSPVDDDYLPF